LYKALADSGFQMSVRSKGQIGGGAGRGEGEHAAEVWKGTQYKQTTLSDWMAPVLSIIATLRIVSWVVFAVLLIITMVGISNTFRMVLMERTREIGTLRALGMQKNQVRNLFLQEALLIAFGGILAGITLSLAFSLPFAAVTWETGGIFGAFLRNGHLNLSPELSSVMLDLFLVTFMSLLAATGPANRAAAVEPALALRTQY
jgi:putative ABC transport system permease protein